MGKQLKKKLLQFVLALVTIMSVLSASVPLSVMAADEIVEDVSSLHYNEILMTDGVDFIGKSFKFNSKIAMNFTIYSFGSSGIGDTYYVDIYNSNGTRVGTSSGSFNDNIIGMINVTVTATLNYTPGSYYINAYVTYMGSDYDLIYPFEIEDDLSMHFTGTQTGVQIAKTNNLNNPLSGWKKTESSYQEYSFYSPIYYSIRLEEMYIGELANTIVEEENIFNDKPSSTQQWILMKFYIENQGGGVLSAEDIIYQDKFYTQSGASVQIADTASFAGEREGQGVFDLDLYSGASGYVWYGILVPKSAGFPKLKVSTGYTKDANYGWLSLDPRSKIVFNGNGSTSGSMATQLVKPNTTVVLKKNVYAKTGYQFAGWNTKADGTGTTYSDGQSIKNLFKTCGVGITLYAQWKLPTYKINYFNMGGATNNPANPLTYNKATPTFRLWTPKKTGYTFGGWYSDKELTKQVTQITKGSTGTKTVYAKWTANKYNISFNGNGATSGTMVSMNNRVYNTSYNLWMNKYKRTGYEFVGWNTKVDGTGTTYKDKQSIKNLTGVNGKTVVLYAMWKPVEYKINYFNMGGATNNAANPLKYTVVTPTFKIWTPKKTGYTFGGWYSDKELTKQVTQITKGSTGIKTVYAKWTPNKYNVSFDGNGATSGIMVTMANCAYGQEYNVWINKYTREGYTFTGWNTKSDGTGMSISDRATFKNLTAVNGKTIILYAQWKEN